MNNDPLNNDAQSSSSSDSQYQSLPLTDDQLQLMTTQANTMAAIPTAQIQPSTQPGGTNTNDVIISSAHLFGAFATGALNVYAQHQQGRTNVAVAVQQRIISQHQALANIMAKNEQANETVSLAITNTMNKALDVVKQINDDNLVLEKDYARMVGEAFAEKDTARMKMMIDAIRSLSDNSNSRAKASMEAIGIVATTAAEMIAARERTRQKFLDFVQDLANTMQAPEHTKVSAGGAGGGGSAASKAAVTDTAGDGSAAAAAASQGLLADSGASANQNASNAKQVAEQSVAQLHDALNTAGYPDWMSQLTFSRSGKTVTLQCTNNDMLAELLDTLEATDSKINENIDTVAEANDSSGIKLIFNKAGTAMAFINALEAKQAALTPATTTTTSSPTG